MAAISLYKVGIVEQAAIDQNLLEAFDTLSRLVVELKVAYGTSGNSLLVGDEDEYGGCYCLCAIL